MKKYNKYISAVLSATVALGIYASSASAYEYFNEPPFKAYKVSKGDSFFYIANRYGVDYRELQRINPNVDARNMQVGSVIRLIEDKNNQTQSADATYEYEVVRLVNVERENRGLKPLSIRTELQNVAEAKSKDMINNNYFNHTSPTHGSPFEMLDAYGVQYRTAGENIAKGQRTPEAVVKAWMNSAGHRKNILSTSFTHIGVGYYKNAWTQLFTG
ncbi:CAP domain-containing protein [Salipaludibacillus neizhouensis]|uniref:CAP domain-containing protein n=1 Tax=Salipaludibacillus neizhouensis TaxID=885475 RepID=UPI001CBA619E|nr:CAP domain-containing protein [Salipaludibacillus neizhouensis]